MKLDLVRPKFIFSAAAGLAIAIVVGYPVGGRLLAIDAASPHGGSEPAFYLAKAGVNRALSQMNQRRANLQALVEGKTIPGCDNDLLYTDIPGGSYKVTAIYDRTAKEFRIIGTGVETKTGQKRSVQLVLRQQPDKKGLLQRIWTEVPVGG
jgi:hypothetical protein